jgi:hypothetical protein
LQDFSACERTPAEPNPDHLAVGRGFSRKHNLRGDP